MALFAQKKLKCFYCGKRQFKNKHDPASAWKCSQCDAVNHLDKSGQIVDPPSHENVPTPRFAQPVPRSTSSEQTSTGTNLFCSTCLKNQQFYTEALANYLPAPEHPQYRQYEASLDEYKRALEERYPQVCVSCEARAIDKIRRAGYAAKTDHLRRLMDKSRSHRVAKAFGWRNLVVFLGQLVYYTSLVGQLVWNLPNTRLSDENAPSLGLLNGGYLFDLDQCLNKAWLQGSLSMECSRRTAPLGGISLVLGLLSIWWNPKWHHKLEGRRGRLRGLKDFYQLQAGALLFRYLAWVWLQDPQTSGLPPPTIRAFHLTLIVINVGLLLASRLIVKIDLTPISTWNEDIQSLIPESVRSQQLQGTGPSFENKAPASFPVSKLAPLPRTSPRVHRIPTPPPDDSADAMEWEPSHNLQPRSRQQGPASSLPQRSPFFGRLPPAPSNKLLNPHPRAADIPERDSIGIPQGFFDPPSQQQAGDGKSQGTSQQFAEPNFFAPSDYKADTGLESIFGKVFSLQEQPTEVRKNPFAKGFANELNAPDVDMVDAQSAPSYAAYGHSSVDAIHLTLAVLLAMLFCLLVTASTFPSLSLEVKGFRIDAASTLVAGLTAAYALLSRSCAAKDSILYLCELLTAAMMGIYTLYMHNPAGKFHLLLSGYVSAMAWQGFYLGMAGKGSIMQNLAARTKGDTTTPSTSLLSEHQHQVSDEIASQSRKTLASEKLSSGTRAQPYPNPETPSFVHKAPYQHISSFRPRSDSTTSFDSSPDSDASTTVTQTSGFRTPRFQSSKFGSGWSPGTGLGSLNISDGPPSGRLRSRTKR